MIIKKLSSWIPLTLLTFGLAMSLSQNAAAKEVKPFVKITSSVLEDSSFYGVIIDNRTYVNLEGLKKCLPFYVLDKGVGWEEKSKTLWVYGIPYPDDPNAYLRFTIGASEFRAGDHILEGDIEVIDGHIYMPLRPIMEFYNLDIKWDEKDKQVTIDNDD
ncbi:copper amine oxidase N-terminal domain-containing protein [Paenibacillus antri]|uniref:Copper amine oxidase N-terminal domain-containing protein n=1 Tax=Paenibacillus antri TaxID=2582848 RepID=A0A5R9GBP1_9BACL|nr:stalk domain-containing protein [Paenibacillus antri]TLS50798.1 copper amine oxidase N-terminal domain-containing protein [Paenibacillus antri]